MVWGPLPLNKSTIVQIIGPCSVCLLCGDYMFYVRGYIYSSVHLYIFSLVGSRAQATLHQELSTVAR